MAQLYLIATPIGNLEDMTYRAVRILSSVEVLACEDTRHTRILLDHYTIPYPKVLLAYHEHNESTASFAILRHLQNGKDVAICSNAGCPSLSDPGYRAVALAIENQIAVTVIPGPHAATMAVIASGLPVSSYMFLGFPPRKTGQRTNWLKAEAENPHTLLMYESPNRIVDLCKDALVALGDRSVCVCFELTKKFERFERGYLSDVCAKLSAVENIKGEITVAIAGKNKKFVRKVDKEES